MQKKASPQFLTNHRRSVSAFASLFAACTLSPMAAAADNPGAHEHGSAQLQLALEDNQIELMFTSPAYNLAGFEHQARNDEEKAQLAQIRQWLESTPLVNTENGACSLASATVKLGGEEGSHHDEDDHDEHHHDEHEDDHHGTEHHEEGRHEEESHRDYDVAQQLTCKGMTSATTLISAVSARFPELLELATEWVAPSGQGSALVTQSKPSFILD